MCMTTPRQMVFMRKNAVCRDQFHILKVFLQIVVLYLFEGLLCPMKFLSIRNYEQQGPL